MYTFEYSGKCMTVEKVVPGNTITSLNSEMYRYTERKLAFTSGGTTEIVVGDWIVGATSAAKAEVIAISAITGAWADGDAAGTLYIRSQHGTFESEKIKVATGSDDATIAADSLLSQPDEYIYKEYRGNYAKYCMIYVSGSRALCLWNGSKPDQTALVGVPLPESMTTLSDVDSIRNFKCVDQVASSASTLLVKFYF
jgi:hypothetical protein